VGFFLALATCAPAAPSDAPAEGGATSISSQSVARLGIKYNSTTPAAKAAVVAVPPPEPIFSETFFLPPFIVTDTRLKLKERDVLTDEGRLAVAEKKYITPLYRVTFGPLSQLATYYYNPLSVFNGWHPNEAEAMTLYREDETVRIQSEMDSLIRLDLIDDVQDAKQVEHLRSHAERVRAGFFFSP
jgi:hypothetical protein